MKYEHGLFLMVLFCLCELLLFLCTKQRYGQLDGESNKFIFWNIYDFVKHFFSAAKKFQRTRQNNTEPRNEKNNTSNNNIHNETDQCNVNQRNGDVSLTIGDVISDGQSQECASARTKREHP